jgi:hypothetical protein
MISKYKNKIKYNRIFPIGLVLMALVHIEEKLKFGEERKKKRKKAYLNNWTP